MRGFYSRRICNANHWPCLYEPNQRLGRFSNEASKSFFEWKDKALLVNRLGPEQARPRTGDTCKIPPHMRARRIAQPRRWLYSDKSTSRKFCRRHSGCHAWTRRSGSALELRLPAGCLRYGALHIVKPKAEIAPEFYGRQFAATCLFSHPPLRYAKLFGELPGGEQPGKTVGLHAD